MIRYQDPQTPWPSIYEYAMAHKCPTCKVPPGVECDAPNKIREHANAKYEVEDHWRLHATRQDAGSRHYGRDVGNAPWPEEREIGKRYDTLNKED